MYKEIIALHSKTRKVYEMVLFNDKEDSMLRRALKSWFVPVDLIKDYYGEDIAIYFEWMNFFLKWMIIPAIAGFAIFIVNNFVYDEARDESPFSAIFSIGMALWATMFAVNWKRR